MWRPYNWAHHLKAYIAPTYIKTEFYLTNEEKIKGNDDEHQT